MFKDVIIFYSLFKIFVRPCLFFWMRRKRKKKEISKWTTNWEVRTVLGGAASKKLLLCPFTRFWCGGKKRISCDKKKRESACFRSESKKGKAVKEGDRGKERWRCFSMNCHHCNIIPGGNRALLSKTVSMHYYYLWNVGLNQFV